MRSVGGRIAGSEQIAMNFPLSVFFSEDEELVVGLRWTEALFQFATEPEFLAVGEHVLFHLFGFAGADFCQDFIEHFVEFVLAEGFEVALQAGGFRLRIHRWSILSRRFHPPLISAISGF